MKSLVLALALVSGSVFAQSVSIDTDSRNTQFKLDTAVHAQMPTKTEIRWIPGCQISESTSICTEEVVLESKAVVKVYVDYTDGVFGNAEGMPSYLTFIFDAEGLSLEPAANRRAYAKKNFTMSVKRATRTIQVVDVRNSKLCQVMESGEVVPGCVERIVYKPAQTVVNEVTVSKK